MWIVAKLTHPLARSHDASAEEVGANMMLEPTLELLERLMVRDYFTQSPEVS